MASFSQSGAQVSGTGLIPWITGAIKELHSKFVGHEKELTTHGRQIASKADKDEIEALKAENAMMKSYLCQKDPNAPFCIKK